MHPDVESLLKLQAIDEEILLRERVLEQVEPRLRALDAERQRAEQALQRARESVEAESTRHREFQERLAQQKSLHDRNRSQLEHVSGAREATAAMAQFERAKQLVEDAERDAHSSSRSVGELRDVVATYERSLADLQASQAVARAQLDEERERLEGELAELRSRREEAARGVGRSVLATYDRVHRRRQDTSVFALRAGACGNCDTAVPLQRRNQMVARGNTEVCEACGVLLYATP